MSLYIAVQNDKPIPVGALTNDVTVIQLAQQWADYSKKPVSVLKVTSVFVDLHTIVLPKEEV